MRSIEYSTQYLEEFCVHCGTSPCQHPVPADVATMLVLADKTAADLVVAEQTAARYQSKFYLALALLGVSLMLCIGMLL